MDDFAVAISGMPKDYMYNRDLNLLTAQLNQHISQIIDDEFEKQNPKGTSKVNLEIADINFGLNDMTDINILNSLTKHRKNDAKILKEMEKDDKKEGCCDKFVKKCSCFKTIKKKLCPNTNEKRESNSKKLQEVAEKYYESKMPKPSSKLSKQKKSVIIAIITFKSMEAKQLLYKAYSSNSRLNRWFLKTFKKKSKEYEEV